MHAVLWIYAREANGGCCLTVPASRGRGRREETTLRVASAAYHDNSNVTMKCFAVIADSGVGKCDNLGIAI